MHVEVRNLEKWYGKSKALDGVSFGFDSGNIFGFVGPNGAGKTTTLSILATLLEPDGGDALIDGISIRQHPEEARRRMGFVPDSLPSRSDISVHEYVDFFARAYGLRGKACRIAVEDVEEFTGLTGFRDKTLAALSKGMKQRVSVARALVHNPSILLLDEPAAGLDPRARIELRELLMALSEQRKAILVSSHILSELTEICSGVIIIERGKILETGPVQDIVKRMRPHALLRIRPRGEVEKLYNEIILMPNVVDAHMEGNFVVAKYDGTEDEAADLLPELMQRGIIIAEFSQDRANLEDIFMEITKGDLQ